MPKPDRNNAERLSECSTSLRQNSNRSLPTDGNGNGSHSPLENGTPEAHLAPGSLSEVHVFEDLFRTYQLKLVAFARRFVKRNDVAEELVEDVFLHLWELRGSWPDPGNHKRYLYAAVRNQALKYIAHQSIERKVHAIVNGSGRVPGMSQSSVTADDATQASELAAAMKNAIDQLPARCREAYTLNREHGMSYAQIASRMGISVRTVETQLARANKWLHRRLAAWIC